MMRWAALLLSVCASNAHAAETIIAGAVGSASAAHWPMQVAIEEGFFAKRGISADLVYAPSNAGVVQQLAAGSIDIAYSAGLADPIRAVAQGAPVALVRIEAQASPYALLANPKIPSIAALAGKTITVGGAKDITRTYLDRMLSAAGVKPASVDFIYAGATSARMAALTSGAVDAALISPPFLFKAEQSGYRNLGYAVDTATDLPFSGTAVNSAWANAHLDLLRRYLDAYGEAVDWLAQDANRAEAVRVLVKDSKSDPTEAEQTYDLFRKLHLFAPPGPLQPARLTALVDVLKAQGDVRTNFSPEGLVLPALSAP